MKRIVFIAGVCIPHLVYAEAQSLPPIINHSTYANGVPYSGGASSQSMLELVARIDSLQSEVQQLRGMVEQQAYDINNLKNSLNSGNVDIYQAQQQAESFSATDNADAEYEDVSMPATESTATPVVQSTATQAVASKADEKAAFDRAFNSVKNSQYQQSIVLFKQFLKDYPTGDYSDNATFWLASVYKVVDDLPQAKASFQAVYTRFPQSEKAGLAMLKLADIYAEEDNQAKAIQLYTQVTTQYANTTAAEMAEKKLQNRGQ